MKPFFSIIMPVYNAEKYLEQAIKSVLMQTFRDWELIIVDDGSSDRSMQISERLAVEDSRVHLRRNISDVHGASVVRNLGLECAVGEYITFVDSDDYLDLDLLQDAYTCLAGQWIDWLKYGCLEEYYNQSQEMVYAKACCMEKELIEKTDLLRKAVELECIPLFGYVWNGFYRRALIEENNIRFNENLAVNEDFVFNIQYMRFCQNLKCLDKCAYHYAKRGGDSLSSKKIDSYYDLHMMKVISFLELYVNPQSGDDRTLQRIFWLYARFCYSALQRCIGSKRVMLEKIRRDKLYGYFKHVDFTGCSLKQRLLVNVLRGNKYLLLLMVSLIDFVRTKFPIVFARWKE